MKKFASVFVCSVLVLVPFLTKAFSRLPDPANLTIVVNTTGGDDTFNFDLSFQNNGSQLPYKSFGLTTINGNTSNLVSINTFGTNTYYISETAPTGWTLGNVSCVTDNPGNIITTNPGFVQISNPTPDSNTTCIFNNSKVSARTPVLIVPGVLGTDIYKADSLLWANPKMSRGFDGFMDPLAFNSDLSPLDASLSLGEVIRQKSFTFLHSDYTNGLINDLVSEGYTEGKDLFTFPYDWRFGVASSTVDKLASQINYIVNTTGSNSVNIVAHSTGGLIVKKYVIDHPNDSHIDKAVFVGVPNLGAPKALKVLTVGDNFDVPNFDPDEMKKIGQNMPVVYDLAPTQEYYNQNGSFMHLNNLFSAASNQQSDLNFNDAMQSLIDHGYANSLAVANSKNLHTTSFDNYDLRNNGINLYNLVGCKIGTFGNFTETINKNSSLAFDFPKITSGDGTVPLVSADSLPVDATKTFFVQNTKHGDLLSSNGTRQEIVNLLTGSTLSTDGKILTRSEVKNKPSLCQIRGESINIKSPVDVGVTDQSGNFSGLNSDGSIQNDIPGADYEIWGEHKYVFLPTDDGQQYQVKLNGTGTGTFTLDDQTVDGDSVTQTQVFSNLPVTPALTGSVNMASDGSTSLTIQASPTGTPVMVMPSSVVDAQQSQDVIPPVSTSTITGSLGQPGFYRSSVSVNLSAQDVVVPGLENQSSGLLKIQYCLDGGAYQIYSSSSPINVVTEGQHVLSFFSTDKAGNNEPEQILGFTIDKTAPEFGIQFNPTTQDLEFTATDSSPTLLSTSTMASLVKKGFKGFQTLGLPTIKDLDDVITATDSAGNTTQITLQNKDRKHQLKADIKSLSYNGKSVDISKNLLHFDWLYDKKGNLQLLTQQVQSKNNFNILSIYALGKTLITGKDQSGKLLKSLNGLALLKVTTNQGDFGWGY